MQRLRDDRGAVAVLTALLLVPLLVCAALVVDIGAGYVQRRQLQNAADASALAIALDCGKGNCSAGNNQTTANSFTSANAPGRAATAQVAPVSGNTVTVTTAATVNYAFAPVIGIRNNTVTAQASASWISPTGGTAVIPLTFSYCSFMAQTSGGFSNAPTVVYFEKSDPTICPDLKVSGGFGWLDADAGQCTATTSITGQSPSTPGPGDWLQSTGNTPPHPQCNDDINFSKYLKKTVLLPLYDEMSEKGGAKAWYHINAYAAFVLTGYDFAGQYKQPATPPCKGSDRCIQGYFLKVVDRDTAFTYGAGAPDVGTQVVTLTA